MELIGFIACIAGMAFLSFGWYVILAMQVGFGGPLVLHERFIALGALLVLLLGWYLVFDNSPYELKNKQEHHHETRLE